MLHYLRCTPHQKPRSYPEAISMAVNLVVGDVVETKIYCAYETQRSINTRHYRVTALAGAGATDLDVADRLDTLWAGHVKALLATPARYLGTSAQIVQLTRRPRQIDNGNNGAGSAGLQGLPRQSCGLIQLTSAVAARSGRGRNYIPFPAEDDNEATAIPSNDYLTRLDALAQDFLIGITVGALPNTASLTPVLYRRDTGTTIDVTAVDIRQIWVTQRRRSDVRGGDREPF